jgi:hypothetical protein
MENSQKCIEMLLHFGKMTVSELTSASLTRETGGEKLQLQSEAVFL